MSRAQAMKLARGREIHAELEQHQEHQCGQRSMQQYRGKSTNQNGQVHHHDPAIGARDNQRAASPESLTTEQKIQHEGCAMAQYQREQCGPERREQASQHLQGRRFLAGFQSRRQEQLVDEKKMHDHEAAEMGDEEGAGKEHRKLVDHGQLEPCKKPDDGTLGPEEDHDVAQAPAQEQHPGKRYKVGRNSAAPCQLCLT